MARQTNEDDTSSSNGLLSAPPPPPSRHHSWCIIVKMQELKPLAVLWKGGCIRAGVLMAARWDAILLFGGERGLLLGRGSDVSAWGVPLPGR